MSTPTEAHRLIVTRAMACKHPQQFNEVLQLLADSEARAVEAATDTAEVYRVQAQYANHQLTAARERVRVLEEQVSDWRSLADRRQLVSDGLYTQVQLLRGALEESSSLLAFLNGAFGDKLKADDQQRLAKCHQGNRAALATPERKEGEQ